MLRDDGEAAALEAGFVSRRFAQRWGTRGDRMHGDRTHRDKSPVLIYEALRAGVIIVARYESRGDLTARPPR